MYRMYRRLIKMLKIIELFCYVYNFFPRVNKTCSQQVTLNEKVAAAWNTFFRKQLPIGTQTCNIKR